MDPLTQCVRYHTPRGRFVHTPPPGPSSDWDTTFGTPWWSDGRYQVGRLSAKTRWIRVVNTLTSQQHTLQVRGSAAAGTTGAVPDGRVCLQVCSEETLAEVLQRYLKYNAHARSYTWKHHNAVLDMNKTLSQNGVPDDDQELLDLRLDPERFVPSLQLYFNDDLSEG